MKMGDRQTNKQTNRWTSPLCKAPTFANKQVVACCLPFSFICCLGRIPDAATAVWPPLSVSQTPWKTLTPLR